VFIDVFDMRNGIIKYKPVISYSYMVNFKAMADYEGRNATRRVNQCSFMEKKP
jgi:hypothetical protein